MDPVPAHIVEKTWQEMGGLSERDIPKLIQMMQRKQPELLAYLLMVDEGDLHEDERELLVYLGVAVWQMMSQGKKRRPVVAFDALIAAEDRNLELIEQLQVQGSKPASFVAMAMKMVESYRQREVLRYVVEALIEESDEGPPVREESLGLLFIDLKTVIDALDA